MVIISQDMIKQFQIMVEANLALAANKHLRIAFENTHQGYITEVLIRFLKARDGNVSQAYKMLVDSLNWRVANGIDDILAKPIIDDDFYRGVRDSQLVGMSGYTKEGRPVFAVGVGLSTYDKASRFCKRGSKYRYVFRQKELNHHYVQSHIQINEYRDRIILPAATRKFERHISTCVKVLDMTGLKLSQLNQIKFWTTLFGIDDLYYPEKTDTYYIVNAPSAFSACWKVMRPLLQERTRNKIHVLQGCGKDELLKIMDYESLPHFCRNEGSSDDNCFSLDHWFHQELYDYVKQQAGSLKRQAPLKHGSFHVDIPEPDPADCKIAQTIQSEFQKLGNLSGIDTY